MFSKLKQFKDLRNKAKQMQGVMAGESAEGSGAWGKVKITLDGNQKITAMSIDDSLLTPSEKNKLIEGIKDALHDATKKIQFTLMNKMKKSGIDLPGL